MASSAELAQLGNVHVLHARATGAIAVVNDTGAQAWAEVSQAPTMDRAVARLARKWRLPRSEARHHLQQLMAQWRQAGLLASEDVTSRYPESPASPSQWGWDRTYACERDVSFRAQNAHFGAWLDRVLTPLHSRTHQRRALSPEQLVEVCLRDDGYHIVRGGQVVAAGLELAPARHVTLRELIVAQAPDNTISAVLHAGAVRIGERALIVGGDTGAGKSTLVASFVCDGADYVCDDLVGLDRDGKSVHPFPVKMSLKPGSAAIMADTIARQADLALGPPDEYGLRYLDATARACPPQPVPVGLICFPRYDARCTGLQCEELTPAQAMKLLLECGARLSGSMPTIAPFAHLLNSVPLLRLTYPDRALAMAAIRERLTA